MKNKAVKKAMNKLVAFALSHPELWLDVSFKRKFDSIWISSELVKSNCDYFGEGATYLTIIDAPKNNAEIPAFQAEIEKQMAYLAIESKKLNQQKGK